MKAKIEFNLPDDQEEFDMASQGQKYYSVLWDLDQYLRGEIKYNDNLSEIEYEYAEKLREKLREMMHDYNINF